MWCGPPTLQVSIKFVVIFRSLGGIWRNLDESGGICERKTLFRMKKEADQAGFKGTRTGVITKDISQLASVAMLPP